MNGIAALKKAKDYVDCKILSGGGEENKINSIKVNKKTLPIASDKSVDIEIPTKTSELENDVGYLTSLKDANDYTDEVYQQSTGYTDKKIADLINGAPSTLDTLGEIAKAMSDNEDVVNALEEAIGKKANSTEMESLLNTKLDKTGDAANTTVTFTQATSRTNIASGEKLSTIFGKIMKWYADLKSVAFSGSYNDLSDKPTIPINTDTKNTAGATNSISKLFLIGALQQATNPTTYSNNGAYVNNGVLYSNNERVVTANTSSLTTVSSDKATFTSYIPLNIDGTTVYVMFGRTVMINNVNSFIISFPKNFSYIPLVILEPLNRRYNGKYTPYLFSTTTSNFTVTLNIVSNDMNEYYPVINWIAIGR